MTDTATGSARPTRWAAPDRWTYDSHGNVLTDTDKDGNTTTLHLRFVRQSYPKSRTLSAMPRSIAYDIMGNQTSMTDADGNTTT